MSVKGWKMNNRRKLVIALGAGAFVVPLGSFAQTTASTYRVGTIDYGARPERAVLWDAFFQTLRDLGYIEGKNVIFEQRWAEGKNERLAGLAADLVKQNVTIIAAAGTPATVAAAHASETIPMVFANLAGDPVALRLVTSFARPNKNITGNTSLSSDLTGKRLELLREAIPSLRRAAMLWDKASPAAEASVREMEAAAKTLGLDFRAFVVSDTRDFEGAFAGIAKARAQALVVASGGLFFTERIRLAELALKHQLPTIFSVGDYADAGGLFAYGPDLKDGMRRAAIYVDRILKGAKPSELPIERPTKFELVINLKTARTLRLKIQQSLLVRADKVIE